jgi:hypothetical protein
VPFVPSPHRYLNKTKVSHQSLPLSETGGEQRTLTRLSIGLQDRIPHFGSDAVVLSADISWLTGTTADEKLNLSWLHYRQAVTNVSYSQGNVKLDFPSLYYQDGGRSRITHGKRR